MSCRSKPTWEHHIGLRMVEDVGNGMGLRLTWGTALPADADNDIHYNIYYADSRFDVFNAPQAVTQLEYVTLNLFEPGNVYYLAVKATEFNPNDFDITEMTQIGSEVFEYPSEQELQQDINDAYGTAVVVEDATGYPDKGFLLVGTEIMKYLVRYDNTFPIEDTNRGSYGTTISTHDAEESVKLWFGVEDSNSIISLGTAAWHPEGGTPRNVDYIGTGEYQVGGDGYKTVAEDVLTVDMGVSDESNVEFPSYDYTGYHKPSMQDLLSGECVRSYAGGEFNGSRGLFLQDRLLARLDMLLQTTGEEVILLKRIWVGKRCRCYRLRRENPGFRCSYCYGTGFEGGYERYVNSRPVSETSINTQGRILIRPDPYTDDLELVLDQGLRQPSEINAWTLPVPTIKDRDIIVRYDKDGIEEFRYECLSVNRNKTVFGQTGVQKFIMRRLDKTDVIYQYLITIL